MANARQAAHDNDLADVWLGDARLTRRAADLVAAIQLRPSESLPEIFPKDADLEAYYRLTNNPRVRPGAIHESHATAAWKRSQASGQSVLLLHDTTEHSFDGDDTREGRSQRGNHQSFWSHFTLAVAESGPPEAFGFVALRAYLCDDGAWKWVRSDGSAEPITKGSDRWIEGIHEVVEYVPDGLPVVHVADREGDAFPMFCALAARKQDFVIRAAHNRTLADDAGKLRDVLADVEHCVVREIELAPRGDRRPPKTKATHPTRDRRPAKLALRAARVAVKRPVGSS